MRNLLALQSWQTKLGVAPYESSSLLSWKVMLSYLVGERRQRVAIGSSYVSCGERTGGLIYHKKVGVLSIFRILFLSFVRELNQYTISKSKPNFAR